MRKYSVLILLFSLTAGVSGFLLRNFELSRAFESDTGLVKRGDNSAIPLFAASLLFVLIITVFAVLLHKKYEAVKGFSNVFTAYKVKYPIFVVTSSVIWITGTVLHLVYLRLDDLLQPINIYFIVLSVIAAVSLILFAIEMYQNLKRKSSYTLSLIPLAFLCFWLILFYRQNAANPVLLSFVYQCLAIVASILTFYYTAGFLYNKPAPAKTMAIYCYTIFFNCVAIADASDFGMIFIFGAILFFTSTHLVLLLHNLVEKQPAIEKQPIVEQQSIDN